MIRITLGDCQTDPVMAECIDYCPTGSDGKWLSYLNKAQQRIVQRGHWVGSSQVVQFCVQNGNLTWPRRVASIEGLDICKMPVKIRNRWYEFLPGGPGRQDADATDTPPTFPNGVNWGAGLQLLARQDACTFADMPAGQLFTLYVYTDNALDVGKKITIQLYDQYGNRYYDPTTGAEGYTLTMANPFSTLPITVQGPIYNVSKDPTVGYVRLQGLPIGGSIQTPLAAYEPDETNPVYRRSLIPALSLNGGCAGQCNPNDATFKTVIGLCKMEVVKMSRPTDFLTIGNMEALRLAMMAIKFENDNNPQLAAMYWGMSLGEMSSELTHYQGAGEDIKIRIDAPAGFEGGVANPI